MPNHPATFALLFVLANAACVDAPPMSAVFVPAPLTGTGQTLHPRSGTMRSEPKRSVAHRLACRNPSIASG